MAFNSPVNCNIEDEIENLTNDILQEIGDSLNDAINQINEIENSDEFNNLDSQIDRGNVLIQDLLNQGDPSSSITEIADLSTFFGLDGEPTEENDEKMLSQGGLILVKGVLHVPGEAGTVSADNIEVFRRLYLSLGKDLAKTERFLNRKKDSQILRRLNIKVFPPISPVRPYSLSEIKNSLGNDVRAEDVSYNSDLEALVVTTSFLDQDVSKQEALRRHSIDESRLVTNVFHYESVKSNLVSIRYWTNLGYKFDELNAILDGTDLRLQEPSPLRGTYNQNRNLVSEIKNTVDFVDERFNTIPDSQKTKLKNKIVSDIEDAIKNHTSLIRDTEFQVATVRELNTLEKLREVHSDEEIKYLLEERTDVVGIKFDPTDDEFQAQLGSASDIGVGSSTLSANFLNQQSEEPVDKSVLIGMYGDLIKAQSLMQTFTKEQLKKVSVLLQEYLDKDPFREIATEPSTFIGQTNMVSLSEVLYNRINYDRSFKIDLRIKAIDDLLADLGEFYTKYIAQNIAKVINSVTTIFKNAFSALDRIVEKMREKINKLKRKLDGFIAKYLSLIGKGDFETSLLKCAINFDIGLSTPILDDLLALIEGLADLIESLIQNLAALIANMLENILCKPLLLLDDLIAGGNNFLPSFCRVDLPISLGDDLTKALVDLRRVGSMRGFSGFNLQGDLVEFRARVDSAPDRLQQFQNDQACRSRSTGLFMNNATSLLSVGKTFQNPGVKAAKFLRGF